MEADAVGQPGLGVRQPAAITVEVGQRDQALGPLDQRTLHGLVVGERSVKARALILRQAEGGDRRQDPGGFQADGADRIVEQGQQRRCA